MIPNAFDSLLEFVANIEAAFELNMPQEKLLEPAFASIERL